MSKYFESFGLVHLAEPIGSGDYCEQLPVQMCRVDGGKLWRLLRNLGLGEDAADTVMRDYLMINTYGTPVEMLLNDADVKLAIAHVDIKHYTPENFLKKLLGSECYHGTIMHLCALIKEYGPAMMNGSISVLPTHDEGKGDRLPPVPPVYEHPMPAATAVAPASSEPAPEGSRPTAFLMYDTKIVFYLVEHNIPREDRLNYLEALFGKTTTMTDEEALAKLKATYGG